MPATVTKPHNAVIVVARRGTTAQASVPLSAHSAGKGDISDDRKGDDNDVENVAKGDDDNAPLLLAVPVPADSPLVAARALGDEHEKDAATEAEVGCAGAAKPVVSLLRVWSEAGGSANN